jgi:hypothetical protein
MECSENICTFVYYYFQNFEEVTFLSEQSVLGLTKTYVKIVHPTMIYWLDKVFFLSQCLFLLCHS